LPSISNRLSHSPPKRRPRSSRFGRCISVPELRRIAWNDGWSR
jgi:hypothetical protein